MACAARVSAAGPDSASTCRFTGLTDTPSGHLKRRGPSAAAGSSADTQEVIGSIPHDEAVAITLQRHVDRARAILDHAEVNVERRAGSDGRQITPQRGAGGARIVRDDWMRRRAFPERQLEIVGTEPGIPERWRQLSTHVEYSLSPMGRDVAPHLDALTSWIERSMPRIERARAKRAKAKTNA